MMYGGGNYGYMPSKSNMNQRSSLEALASAVALPGVYTDGEMLRTLYRNNGDIMRTALQLKEKYSFRKEMHYLNLTIAFPTVQEELRKGYVHLLDTVDEDGCPVILLQLQYFKPGVRDNVKLHRQGRGAADGSGVSSLEDARRLCVYLLDVAVALMEKRKAPGIVFLVDVVNCSLANLETNMVTDILYVCKKWYPEIVKRILVVNSSGVARIMTLLLSKLVGSRTQQRIRVVSEPRELNLMLPRQAIPHVFGGDYRLVHPNDWMKKQAELEAVDLNKAYTGTIQDQEEDEEDAKGYGLEEREVDPNECLNGMQYANLCAVDAAEMPNSVLRGPLMRKKMDGVWAKHFALLRPEALLLYENTTGLRPVILIPVNYEVRVVTATFPERPKNCGFRIEIPGMAGGHELSTSCEQERNNWLQELQRAIDTNREKLERREEREERRAKLHREFDALNMIDFDVDLVVPAPPKTVMKDEGVAEIDTFMAQLQVRPPQHAGNGGMLSSMQMPMSTTMPSMMGMMPSQSQWFPTPITAYQPQQQPMMQMYSNGMQNQSTFLPTQPQMSERSAVYLGSLQRPTIGVDMQQIPMSTSMQLPVQQQQLVTNMEMQEQWTMSMNQSMVMGSQQPMQMTWGHNSVPLQPQKSIDGCQTMNMPLSSGYKLDSKSLQEQLLNNFRG